MKQIFMVACIALVVLALPALGSPSSGQRVFSLSMQDEPAEQGSTTETEVVETSFSLDGPSYLISDQPLFGDAEVLWPGFLTGMRSKWTFQEKFASPVGSPLYFEDPFIQSSLRFVYLWHDFSPASQLAGGELSAWALQVRLALTERLALIATKDGYTTFKSGITPDGDGWNDAALGLKYLFLVDEPNEFALAGGLRWEWHNGDRDILQGGDGGHDELSPFISLAKGWDRFHFIGALNYRVPMDWDEGNHVLHWDAHFDYEIAPDMLPGFFPLFELHGVHYITDGERLPLGVGGLDYTNLGSTNVAGSSVIWGDLGFRWKLTPNTSFGAAYGFPISNPANDIFGQRVTVDFIFSF